MLAKPAAQQSLKPILGKIFCYIGQKQRQNCSGKLRTSPDAVFVIREQTEYRPNAIIYMHLPIKKQHIIG